MVVDQLCQIRRSAGYLRIGRQLFTNFFIINIIIIDIIDIITTNNQHEQGGLDEVLAHHYRFLYCFFGSSPASPSTAFTSHLRSSTTYLFQRFIRVTSTFILDDTVRPVQYWCNELSSLPSFIPLAITMEEKELSA